MKKILFIAVVLVVIGGVTFYYLKRKRKEELSYPKADPDYYEEPEADDLEQMLVQED